MKAQGFTLLEIMIALVIVTTVFMGCYMSLTQMIKSTDVLTQKTLVALVVNKEFANARLAVLPNNEPRQATQIMGGMTFNTSVVQTRSQPYIDEIEIRVLNTKGEPLSTEFGYKYVEKSNP